jgi:Type I phosphodiesterase / nucleotide pyrophosphatase
MKDLRHFAERAVLVALSIGTVAAVLFVGLNDLQPAETPRTFALAFLEWSLAFYGLALAFGLLAVWGLAAVAVRLVPRARLLRRLPDAALAAGAAAFLLACAAWNGRAVMGAFDVGGPARFRWLTPLALVLAVAAIVLAAAWSSRLGPARRLLTAAALAAALVAFLPERATSARVPAPRPVSSRDAAGRLLVFGIDGADWTLMDALIARGDLPNLAALKRRGAWGELETLFPTRSPAVWTTIATGQPPERHGIESFTSRRVAGIQGNFRHRQRPRAIGFGRLTSLLEERGLITDGPITSSLRRVPALWNIASEAGSPIAVVDWWATWPAEPVLGAIVSDRVNFWRMAERGHPPEDSDLTFPRGLEEELRGLILSPDAVTIDQARPFMDVTPAQFAAMQAGPFRGKTVESEFKYLYAMYETDRRAAVYLVERTRRQLGFPADLMVLLRTVDIACHSALQYSELVSDHLGEPEADVERFGRVVSESYRAVDRALGDLLAAMGETNVVVVSDHGFHLETTGEGAEQTRLYHHMLKPPGVFIAAGPAFRPGRVEGMTVYDVLPTLVVLKRLPLAQNLPGRVHDEVFAPAFLSGTPIQRVASYGRRGGVRGAGAGTAADEEALERLRALGYIR